MNTIEFYNEIEASLKKEIAKHTFAENSSEHYDDIMENEGRNSVYLEGLKKALSIVHEIASKHNLRTTQ
jgi:hypothetical protein